MFDTTRRDVATPEDRCPALQRSLDAAQRAAGCDPEIAFDDAPCPAARPFAMTGLWGLLPDTDPSPRRLRAGSS